jgi:glycosyltransferase involved in cell wall biosynthesis
MACGTPVAALRRGAVGEIVRDGVSGYAFDSIDELIVGLPKVCALDRRKVREHAVERFDTRSMVDGYERLYRRVVQR